VPLIVFTHIVTVIVSLGAAELGSGSKYTKFSAAAGAVKISSTASAIPIPNGNLFIFIYLL
jgi:hypothetical protein